MRMSPRAALPHAVVDFCSRTSGCDRGSGLSPTFPYRNRYSMMRFGPIIPPPGSRLRRARV
jgi:hypothetical protein